MAMTWKYDFLEVDSMVVSRVDSGFFVLCHNAMFSSRLPAHPVISPTVFLSLVGKKDCLPGIK